MRKMRERTKEEIEKRNLIMERLGFVPIGKNGSIYSYSEYNKPKVGLSTATLSPALYVDISALELTDANIVQAIIRKSLNLGKHLCKIEFKKFLEID